MADKKVFFVAFAIEDERQRDFLKGQSLNTNSPFEHVGMSVKRHTTQIGRKESARESNDQTVCPDPENTRKFSILQRYNRLNLLVPVDAEQSVERERRITSVLKSTVTGRRHVNRNVRRTNVRTEASAMNTYPSLLVLLVLLVVQWRRNSASDLHRSAYEGYVATVVRRRLAGTDITPRDQLGSAANHYAVNRTFGSRNRSVG